METQGRKLLIGDVLRRAAEATPDAPAACVGSFDRGYATRSYAELERDAKGNELHFRASLLKVLADETYPAMFSKPEVKEQSLVASFTELSTSCAPSMYSLAYRSGLGSSSTHSCFRCESSSSSNE